MDVALIFLFVLLVADLGEVAANCKRGRGPHFAAERTNKNQ